MLGSTNSPRSGRIKHIVRSRRRVGEECPRYCGCSQRDADRAGAIAVGAAASEAVSGPLDPFFATTIEQEEGKASGDAGQQITKIVKVFKRTEKGTWERVRAVAQMAEDGDESIRDLAKALKPWNWGKSKISEMTLVAKDFPPEVVLHDYSIDFHSQCSPPPTSA